MGYAAGEARLLTIVQATSGFSSSNTSRADWGILNKGRASVYAVVVHAGTASDFFTLACYRDVHTAAVEIWQRYVNDGSTATNLQANVDAVRAKINTYRHGSDSSGATLDFGAVETGEIEEMWNRSGGPHWLRQIIRVQWQELVSPTYV